MSWLITIGVVILMAVVGSLVHERRRTRGSWFEEQITRKERER